MKLQKLFTKTAGVVMLSSLLSIIVSCDCNNDIDNVETGLLATDFMMTFICPNNIFELGDVVMSYYSENGAEIKDTLSPNDFIPCKEENLPLTISGNYSTGVKTDQMYWQKKFHYKNHNVQQQILIWFLPKVSSYSFTSIACFDAVTTGDSGNKIDALPYNLNVISPTVIGININTDPKLAEKKLLFGAKYNVDENGKISSEKIAEKDVREHILSEEQLNYLTDCVKQLLNKAYLDLDEIKAALPNDGEEKKVFEYTDMLPEKLFGKAIDIAYELTPYTSIVMFEFKVKPSLDSDWRLFNISAYKVDEIAESMKDPDHLEYLINMVEEIVYKCMKMQ